jgi:hypothetical protein
MDSNQLIIMALQQRIGELELEKAAIRAEFTIQSNTIETLQKEINDYAKIIEEKSNCSETSVS